MKLIDSIYGAVNYRVTQLASIVKKVGTSPSLSKKFLQVISKSFEAYDWHHIGYVKDRKITSVMKGATELIGFYGTFNNLMYWANLFSKESLDQGVLKESIESSLCSSHTDPRDIEKQKKIAQKVFEEVMAEEKYYSRGEVFDALKISLEKHGYRDPAKAEAIANRVIVQQKERPLTQRLYMVCFTIADLGGNILTLKKWNILDLSHIAASIGSQSPVFMFIVDLGAETVLGVVASAGLVLVVGEATYRTIIHGMKLYNATDPEERKKAYQEFRNAGLDLLAGGTDLVYVAAPLLFALNPPAIVALAIVAKGTGLVCALVR